MLVRTGGNFRSKNALCVERGGMERARCDDRKKYSHRIATIQYTFAAVSVRARRSRAYFVAPPKAPLRQELQMPKPLPTACMKPQKEDNFANSVGLSWLIVNGVSDTP